MPIHAVDLVQYLALALAVRHCLWAFDCAMPQGRLAVYIAMRPPEKEGQNQNAEWKQNRTECNDD
jgi:hypothetical protein